MTWYWLRRRFSNLDTQDPRDKVFSALALLNQYLDLGIELDYSQDVETLYIGIARRSLFETQSLDLLESCLLASRVPEIPSWVPDWSSPIRSPTTLQSYWSACGWISSHFSAMDDELISVAGIAVSPVRWSINIKERQLPSSQARRRVEVFRLLKFVAPTSEFLDNMHTTQRGWAAVIFPALFPSYTSYLHWPGRKNASGLNLEQYAQALAEIWASIADSIEINFELYVAQAASLELCRGWLDGRCLFTLDNGFVGLADNNLEDKDLLAVLLGNKFPVALRTARAVESTPVWEVVSTCCVAGVVKGEIVYGGQLPAHYRAVSYEWEPPDGEEEGDWPLQDHGGQSSALDSPRSQNLRVDPEYRP